MLPGLSRLDNHKMQYLLYDQKRIKHSKRTFNRGMSQRFHHISMSYNFDEMAQCSNAEFPLYYIGRNVCSSLPQNPYRSFWQHPGYLAMSLQQLKIICLLLILFEKHFCYIFTRSAVRLIKSTNSDVRLFGCCSIAFQIF